MVLHFPFVLHHKGTFLFEPLRYEYGEEIRTETDEVSYTDFKKFIEGKTDNNNNVLAIYYVFPNDSLEKNKIKKIASEEDLFMFYALVDAYGALHVYIDHDNADLNEYLHVTDDSFTINVCYDGDFIVEPFSYKYGKKTEISNINLTYDGLVEFIKALIGGEPEGIIYKIPNGSNNINRIGSEEDLVEYFELVKLHGPIDVCVDHFGAEDLSYHYSQFK